MSSLLAPLSAGGAIGDLLLVYKKVQRLAGLTTRVSELLEALERMEAAEGIEVAGAAEAATKAGTALEVADGGGGAAKGGACVGGAVGGGEGGESVESRESLRMEGVSVRTPDGRCLVKQLSLRLPRNRSLLVTGPNGAGKSSLVRALKGLWPLQSGTVHLPQCGEEGLPSLCFVPQNAYMMMGTLRDQARSPSCGHTHAHTAARRSTPSHDPSPDPNPDSDQVLYPDVPLGEAEGARACVAQDARVAECLGTVGLAQLLSSMGLDTWQQDWLEVLSGGEKQRVGLARLLYHRPAFAVLDEATSAVNGDEQGRLHECLLEAGITLLSIAHRPEVRPFHQLELQLAGDGSGAWKLVPLESSNGGGQAREGALL